jgi:hypothetical protein
MSGRRRYAAYIQATTKNTSVVRSRDHLFQILRIAPEGAELRQNLNQINVERDRLIEQFNTEIKQLKQGGWEDLHAYLIQKRTESDANHARWRKMSDEVGAINSDLIKHAETAVSVLTVARDVSIVGLGIIATVATGGTALAVATVGQAGLQGVATYQDTGDLNKALASGTFIMVTFGAGKAVSGLKAAGTVGPKVATAITVMIEVGEETANQVVIDEKALDDAIYSALLKQGVSEGSKVLSKSLASKIGTEIKDTIKVLDDHGGRASNRIAPLLAETARKFGQAGANQVVKAVTTPSQVGHQLAVATASRSKAASVFNASSKAWVEQHVLRRL